MTHCVVSEILVTDNPKCHLPAANIFEVALEKPIEWYILFQAGIYIICPFQYKFFISLVL